MSDSDRATKAAPGPWYGAGFEGVFLGKDEIRSPHGGGPLAGAHATVETAGRLSRRISLTRAAATGVLPAWAWRKKIDDRELYLVVEGRGWGFSAPVDPKKGAQAREFAARINARASWLEAAERSDAQATEADPMEQLRKLAELRDIGAVTPEEFEAKKAELLKRL